MFTFFAHSFFPFSFAVSFSASLKSESAARVVQKLIFDIGYGHVFIFVFFLFHSLSSAVVGCATRNKKVFVFRRSSIDFRSLFQIGIRLG